MKSTKMMMGVLALAAMSTTFSSQSFAADVCEPSMGITGETATPMTGTESTGFFAHEEIGLARLKGGAGVSLNRDLFGRLMFIESRSTVRDIKSLIDEVNEVAANARVDRYCSESSVADAKCVNLCVRWTYYYGERP